MEVLTKIIVFIVLVPFILILVWGIIDTKSYITSGQRWRYKGELEPTEEAIEYHKKLCIVGIFVTIVGYLLYAIFG